MSVDAGSVYSSIRVRLGDLDNDLKGVYARLGQLESNITKTSTNSASSFNTMFGAVVSGQAVLALAQKGFSTLTGFIKESTEVARDSQEMISKYDVVFGGMGDASEAAAKKFSDSFDLAGATSKEMLSNTGNLLQGMGATKEESLALSLEVNTLASDLSSFTNNAGGSKAASEALTKALLGEKESMKTLGIAILDSDVNARVAKNGQDNLTGTALKLAKAQATLQLITEQSKNAIGDYARTQDSAANVQKRAAESTKALQIAVGTALNPAITLAADIWAKVSGALAEVITKQNELRGAEKSVNAGNATYEQRILVLQNQKKELEALSRANKIYGIDGKEIATDLSKSDAIEIANIQALVESLQRQSAIEKGLATAKAKSDSESLKKEQEKAKQIEDTIAKYKAERETVSGILSDNKTDYQKIQDQIDSINLAWAKGTILEKDRQAALEILIGKQNALTEAGAETGDNDRESAQEKLAAMQETLDAVDVLGAAEVSESEKARSAMIEQIKTMGYVPEQQQELIDKVNEYYDTIEDQESTAKFVSNVSSAIGTASSLFSAFSDLVNQINQNEVDAQEDALDDEYDALEASLEERQNLETEYLEALQEAEDDALATKYDNLNNELDAELQAKLYAAGLAEADTVEQYAAELATAIASGDAETIADAQDAYDKSVIEQEYADKATALAAQQAAEELAVDTAQAEATAALEAKQAAETTALEEEKAKKTAEIEYNANLASWEMQLALAAATAAQAVLGAYAAPPFFPLNAASVAITAGVSALQVAAVAAAKPALSYATGGIVPGTSYTGDLVTANVNSGEMILNGTQQAKLYALLNSDTAASGSSSSVTLSIGTFVGSKSSLRELNRKLQNVSILETRRRG